jgi:L-alanine-DL-glutamate epimerase-like enolase superfamily enzyme
MNALRQLQVDAFTVPTDAPESDGTLEWHATTLVLVRARAGGHEGIGYTYADEAAALCIARELGPHVVGVDALDIPTARLAMSAAVRNVGRRGIAALAISAVDNALWDLKAQLLELPMTRLLGAVRASIDAYGSGGFCSYDRERLQSQLAGWVERDGARAVKLKVGREPARDPGRVAEARAAVGEDVELFVDANGAWHPRGALDFAERCAGRGVTWFEEPVVAEDLDGLRHVRERVAPSIRIAAGEYGWTLDDARRMLQARAVDVLQVDATRCGGISGLLAMASLSEAFHVPVSAHCAPSLHAPAMCSVAGACNIEYFHDHVRLEQLCFDGAARMVDGQVTPHSSASGFGLTLREADMARWRVASYRCTEERT